MPSTITHLEMMYFLKYNVAVFGLTALDAVTTGGKNTSVNTNHSLLQQLEGKNTAVGSEALNQNTWR